DQLAHSPLPGVSVEALRNRLAELRNGVSEAIYGLSPLLASVRFPTSKLRQSESPLIPPDESYMDARSLLDRASLVPDPREKSVLLEQAGRALDVVWNDYQSRDTPLITIAFIRYEQGRLRFWLQDYENARMLFTGAREIFGTSENYFDEVAKIDQHLAV